MDIPTTTVGVIGLGSMGMGMACSMVRAGLTVRGADLSADARSQFEAAGGIAVDTPAAAADGADLVIAVVVNAKQVDAVLFGPNGAVNALSPGSVIMQSATVPPEFTRALATRLAAYDLLLLDGPVSGGKVRAQAGEITVMASGPDRAFDIADKALKAMAAKVYRLSEEPGIGSTVKIVNQLLAGVHIATAAEAMAFGTRAGADPAVLFEVISNSAGNSWMFENRVPNMLSGDYTPSSAVDIFVKDLGLVLDTSRSLTFPLPLAAAAHQLFMMASAAGYGREDDSAVVKVFEDLAGINVTDPAGKSGSPGD